MIILGDAGGARLMGWYLVSAVHHIDEPVSHQTRTPPDIAQMLLFNIFNAKKFFWCEPERDS